MKNPKEQLLEAAKNHDSKSWILAVENGVSAFTETSNKSNSIFLALNYSAPLAFIKLVLSTMMKEDPDFQKISACKSFGGSLLNWITIYPDDEGIISFLQESNPSLLQHLIDKEFKDNITNPLLVLSRNTTVFNLSMLNNYPDMLNNSRELLHTPEALSSWCSSNLLTREFLEGVKKEGTPPLWTKITNHYHFIPLHQKINVGDWQDTNGNTLFHLLLNEDKKNLSDSKKKILKFYARKNPNSLNMANNLGETPYYLFLKRVQKGDFSISVLYEKEVVEKVLWKFEDPSIKSLLKLLEKLGTNSQYNKFDFQNSEKHCCISDILKMAHEDCLIKSLKDAPAGNIFKGPRF